MSFQSITNSSPSSIVTEDRISKAVDSLLKWVKSKTTPQNPQLLEHDELLYLVLTLKKIPPTSKTNPFKIPLPHPYFSLDGTQELCLIIDDRSNRIDSKTAKQKIEVEKIPITKVLRFSKLKSDFRPFESKRQLCGSYDIFFADRRIIPLLPRLLGKTFFKTKKIPIPVDLTHKNWKEQIKNACGSCLLYLRTGTCSVVKVGKVSQPREEIVKNVAAAIEGIAEIVPKKWDNVRSLHLKLLNSVALPLHQSIPETGLLKIEVPKNLGMEESGNRIELGDEEKEKKSPGGKEVKKGKIQQFRYMDHNLDDMSADLLSDDDDDDDGNRIEEMSVVEKVGEKRKKMPAKSNQVLDSKMDELDHEQLELEKSSKEKKGERVKKSKKNKATNGGIPVSSPSVYLDVGKKKKKKKKKEKEASSGETLVSSFVASLDVGKKMKEATKGETLVSSVVASLDVGKKRKEATKGETLVSSSLTSLDVGKKKRKKEATSGETLISSFGASLDVGKKKKEATQGETLVSSFLTALDVGKKKKEATKGETLVSSYLTPLDGGKKKKKKEANNEMLVGSSSPSFDVGKKKKKQESKKDELADKGTEVKNKESKKRHKIR